MQERDRTKASMDMPWIMMRKKLRHEDGVDPIKSAEMDE